MAAGVPMLIVACLLMTSGVSGVSSSILRVARSYITTISRREPQHHASQELRTLVTYLNGQAFA